MNNIIRSINRRFNLIEPAALIVIVLSIFYIGFQPGFNEEIYFAFSKAYMDPLWIPDSTLFTDFAGTRILFQFIFGWILKFVSFENMAFFGRLTGYILLAFPIAAIAKHIRINNIILVFWLAVFFIPHQSFFAGEWVFGGFETKIIAYVFVFWSVWFLFKERFLPAVIFAAISVYWHMLVGGWYTLYVFIYLLITLGINRKFILYWLYAGLILLPFVVYIYLGLMSGNDNIINGVNIGYLYAYVRNPHHIGIVKDWDYFYQIHAGKVFVAIVAYILALTAYRRQIPERYRWVNTFLIIILSQNLLFLIVALFDKNGFIAKFYPWRGSTMAMFFFLISTILMLRHIWIPWIFTSLKKRYPKIRQIPFYAGQMSLFLLITIITLGFKIDSRIEKADLNKPRWIEVNTLASNLKNLSEKGDMFMLLGKETLYNITIPRKAERDVYYFFRCIPSQAQSIYDWHMRGLEQDKVKSDLTYLVTSGLAKKIDFIVSDKDLKEPFLGEVYRSAGYRVYKVLHDN